MNKDQKKINQIINESDEIDIIALWKRLILGKSTIIKITLFFATLGIIYSLLATPYYKSTISMYPAAEVAETSSIMGGNLKGLAESFGIGGLGTAPSYNIPDIINSRRLKKDIVLKSWTNSQYPKGSNLIKYWDIDKYKWFMPWEWFYKIVPSKRIIADIDLQHIDVAIEKLNSLISVDEAASGLITVSVWMEEPELSADIANYISKFIIDFIQVEQHREASKNKSFIRAQLMQAKNELSNSEEELTEYRKEHPMALDTPDLQLGRGRLIRNVESNQAISITLRQQYEMAKIEEARESLLVNILDIAESAVNKDRPKWKLVLLLCIILGVLSGVAITLIRHTLDPS